MPPLSAKEYILTRARTLPIYKCLVAKGWKESQITGVIVIRKHTNGNITAGYYNIDLLCLGVKATRFSFNVPEEEVLEGLGDGIVTYEEIDYALAHNIIFAGHDFAMDFDIHPHKDFQITRFILEEDNDDIPLIDIPVGKNGIPHLMAIKANDRLKELAKLKKNAGEGNYFYSVAEFENFDMYFLDNIPPGGVNCETVLNIELEDLQDEEKVKRRNSIEQIYLETELYTRLLPEEYQEVDTREHEIWKKKWKVEFSYNVAGITDKQFDGYNQAMDELIAGSGKTEEKMIPLANKYADNPLAIAGFYEKAVIMQLENAIEITKAHAEKLYADCPLLQLSLALGAMIQGTTDPRFDHIYEADSIRKVIPGQSAFHVAEFVNFGLIKMWQCLDKGDVGFAVKFYNMLANSGGRHSTMISFVWARYLTGIKRIVDGADTE